MTHQPLHIAMIGCGAAAEFIHLPALGRRSDCEIHTLVDAREERAKELAERFGAIGTARDYREMGDGFDAAIVALPHHLHADAAVHLLSRGVHVLVEKPMAATADECRRMIDAAQQSKAILSVGMVRRFYRTSQFVKGVISAGLLGSIRNFDWREGYVFGWPVASDFMFRRSAGGGLMGDIGSHVLDLLLWWFGDFESVEYFDDALGGVEAECEVHLRSENGLTGLVELSRTRNLRNTCIIRGESATLEFGVDINSQVRLTFENQNLGIQGRALLDNQPQQPSIHDAFQDQLGDFIAAITCKRPPLVTGCEGSRVVEMLERCAVNRRPLDLPWLNPGAGATLEESLKTGAIA